MMRHSKIAMFASCSSATTVFFVDLEICIVFRNLFGCQVITEDLSSRHRSERQFLRVAGAQEAS